MILSEDPSALKKFRRSAGAVQRTFETPLKNLPAFVSTILNAAGPIQSARVTLDQVVFEPTNLRRMLGHNGLLARSKREISITAGGREEIETLLRSTLGDSIDFCFVPQPHAFSSYADHDEFTTFYANKLGNLNRVTEAPLARGFKKQADYARQL